MKKLSLFLLIFFANQFILRAQSLPYYVIDDTQGKTSIGEYIYNLVDTEDKFTFEEVKESEDFIVNGSKVPNLGINNHAHWIKIPLLNRTHTEEHILELNNPNLTEIEFYFPSDTGYVKKVTGLKYGHESKMLSSERYLFPIKIQPGTYKEFYFKVKADVQLTIPVSIVNSELTEDRNINSYLFFGLYVGVILVMFFYNLFIYLSVKNISYLYYVAHTLFVGLTQSSIMGFSHVYLWPSNSFLATISVPLFTVLVSLVGIEFFKHFLKVKHFLPKLYKALFVFSTAYTVVLGLIIYGEVNLAYKILQPIQGMVVMTILISSIIIYKKKYRPALFFLSAWSVLFLSILTYLMVNVGLLPYNDYTAYAMAIGSIIEVSLLAMALADSINQLKKQREEAIAQKLATLEENKHIMEHQNVLLESKVQERTVELKESNQELNKTLTNLKMAQSKLVESEKMASLGQLTAGVAHEINNPINFVASNVMPLRRDILDIFSIVDKYEDLKEKSTEQLEATLEEIEEFKEDLEYSYLKEEIEQLLQGITEGANRTTEIVRGLKNFSRLDENDLKVADVNEGLQSTLVLLQNKTKHSLKLITEYGGIPKIECLPGKLNQVFMNIISNAIQAVEERDMGDGEQPTVVVSTSLLNQENIEVRISDNGIGMPEHVKSRIFEPFFTTKDVGVGTGLGLSIVFRIINKHNGNIKVNSEPGKGTEFIITLPVKQSYVAQEA